MLFAIRFTDNPEKLAVRKEYMTAHLDWVTQHDMILVAGSLRAEPEEDPVGALWVVDVESKADAAQLFETDPFFANGLRAGYEILHWSKAFPQRKTLV